MSPATSTTANSHDTVHSDCLANAKPDLFELGQTVCTTALDGWAQARLPTALLEGNLWLLILVKAHVTGCWEHMYKKDRELNYRSLETDNEGRIFSAFTILDEKIYVITEWDRSVTTVMLASDY